jgi:hypothetical protein
MSIRPSRLTPVLTALVFSLMTSVLLESAHATSIEPVAQEFQKLMHARSHSETTVTDEKGQVTRSRTDFDTYDRIHATTDHAEFVVLPEGTWMKTGGGWTKPPVDMSSMVRHFLPVSDEVVRSARNVSDDGMTTWQGQPAHAYTYDIDTMIMGIHATGHSKTYLDATGQIIGSEIDSVAMKKKTHTVQMITYDDSIRVKAPM